jgi:DNA-binding IclR family transcriptional regulator
MLLTMKHSVRYANRCADQAVVQKKQMPKSNRLQGTGNGQWADVKVVLRAPGNGTPKDAPINADDIIAPIERGLAILAVFGPADQWLGNQEISAKTGIPKATVTRLTQTLTDQGFLNHSTRLRKYRLAAAVLGLGYVTMDNSHTAAIARVHMQKLADDCGVFVSLVGRDGLDVSLLENCHSASSLATLGVNVGARFPIAANPFGLALLSGLPLAERNYLLDHIRLRYQQEYRVNLRSRVADAVAQVSQKGYCVSICELGSEITVAAAPLNIPDRPPMAIGCAGPARLITREKLREEIGPRLVELVSRLQDHAGLTLG